MKIIKNIIIKKGLCQLHHGCPFGYDLLSEWQANNIKEIDDLYRLIESLSFQSQLEQVI